MRVKGQFIIVFFLLVASTPTFSQNGNGNGKNLTQRLIDKFYQEESDTVITLRSEDAFKRFQGKIIRRIIIEQYGFERTLYDTSRRKVLNDIVKLGNKLHTTTREKIIRNHLFIREKKPLDPYKVADNERFLRDLDFILDARIVVKPVRGSKDEIDLIVITRDVFSIGGSFDPSGPTETQFGVFDVNIDGRGQRARFNALVDTDRDPQFGHQFLYSKSSVAGSLINATISYTQINNGASLGLENEKAVFLRLDRPLVSPYTRFAGGLEVSRNWSSNDYNIATENFRSYNYVVHDVWVGYLIGIHNKTENRNRHFVGIRAFDQHFNERPTQAIEELNPIYNNQKFVLGEISFFNQNFYKTRYIYGFGRTEDVPYGRVVTLLAGVSKQFNLERIYLGADIDKTIVRPNGDFHQYTLRLGAFRKDDSFEDIALLASASLFSKLIQYKSLKIRQSVQMGYTAIMKSTPTSLPLRINNEFGVRGFAADSLLGNKRIGISTETTIFTPLRLIGFHFAPFVFADMAMISPQGETIFKEKPYFGLGGGIRTRNENLVFGTMELRFFYFPRIVDDVSQFKITLSSNLRVKYTSGFVRAPAFIRYN